MRTSLCLLLVASLLLPSARAVACPVWPASLPTLGRQVKAASAIVVARLEGSATESQETGEGEALHFEYERYRVLQTIKGSAPARFRVWTSLLTQVPIPFTPSDDARPRLLFVAAPDEGDTEDVPDEEPSRRVDELAFDDANDLAVFLERVQEAQRLLERRASQAEEREWLVRCAMRRVTRGHAVQALISSDGRVPADGSQLAMELTHAQRRAILDGFRQEPTTDGTFVAVLALGRGVPHPAFDRVAVGVMETLLSETEGDMARDTPHALYLLMERLGVPDREGRWSATRVEPSGDEDDRFARAEQESLLRSRALWSALRAEGLLVPAPRVPHAWSAVDRVSLTID